MHDEQVLVTTIATLATAMLFTMTTSNAATYKFTFQSNDAELRRENSQSIPRTT